MRSTSYAGSLWRTRTGLGLGCWSRTSHNGHVIDRKYISFADDAGEHTDSEDDARTTFKPPDLTGAYLHSTWRRESARRGLSSATTISLLPPPLASGDQLVLALDDSLRTALTGLWKLDIPSISPASARRHRVDSPLSTRFLGCTGRWDSCKKGRTRTGKHICSSSSRRDAELELSSPWRPPTVILLCWRPSHAVEC